jgi:putative membrane protein
MKSFAKIGIMLVAIVIGSFTLTSTAQAQAPTDPQIVGIVLGANQIDMDYAKLALSKTKNKEVHDFAQQMMTDHSSLQKSVKDLGAKLNVTPADSDTAKSLKQQAADETKKLQALKGKDFDKAYIDNEVAYHQQVIDAVSKVLIPNAQNAELKSALTGAAPLFQGHLEHAQKLQSTVAGSSSAATHQH